MSRRDFWFQFEIQILNLKELSICLSIELNCTATFLAIYWLLAVCLSSCCCPSFDNQHQQLFIKVLFSLFHLNQFLFSLALVLAFICNSNIAQRNKNYMCHKSLYQGLNPWPTDYKTSMLTTQPCFSPCISFCHLSMHNNTLHFATKNAKERRIYQ